ncbi:MAG: OsmC family protein [Natronospirillum sp.]
MKRYASAHWQGGLKDGTGTLSTHSGALAEQPYSFGTRFEEEPGTNPEELIGAAHAACFSMALSMVLGESNAVADSIDTKATVSLEKQGDGFAVTAVHLDLLVRAPSLDLEKLEQAANTAKDNCPISKLLNANITLTTELGN